MFNVVPDKKFYPDYYTFIKAPTSFNSIKKRLNHYHSPNEFIRDIAQIVWNARTYNEKDSFVYRYAQVLDDFLKDQVIPKFKKAGFDVGYPDLAPITEGVAGALIAFNHEKEKPAPPPTATPVVHQTRYSTSTPQPLSRASLRSTPGRDDDFDDEEETVKKRASHREQSFKRGRPPVIDKPFEQRIKNVLRTLRKEKDQQGESVTAMFERLPDPRDYPDYYKAIAQPISLDEIKKKIKQRKYKDVDPFVQDMKLMIANAKYYNDESSLVYKNTLLLEKYFVKLLEAEMKKPDSDYISADSLKLPLEQLELHGKLFKIGDWILINNPNDPQKPIVAQLFRIWQTPQDGQRWINVCWYLRPEQTVHRVDRLFYENEVFKSGQYRDHLADEIIGKCYVAYFTRYQRGDPAVPYEGPLFICEYRYNDNDKNFNKIRTWRACLPDEVRDHEDPITPLPALRRFKKIESPLKHLLPPNATPHMPIPEPTIGAPNAPPLHGAVYLRDVDETDDLGQYASSRTCPKYIIRPNDPTPTEGDSTVTTTPLHNYTRNVVNQQQQTSTVYHATPTYVPTSSASTFTVPISLQTATSGLIKMDISSNRRRLAGMEVNEEGPVVWFRTPGVMITNRLLSNTCIDVGQIDEDGQVQEEAPGSGFAGVVGAGHSAEYITWKKRKLGV
jgi:chromatin structure-remodeling complex subunit RSC1/2